MSPKTETQEAKSPKAEKRMKLFFFIFKSLSGLQSHGFGGLDGGLRLRCGNRRPGLQHAGGCQVARKNHALFRFEIGDLREGNLAFLDGDFKAAETHYLKASDSDPGDADIWMNLLKAELRLKNKEKAQDAARKAVAVEANLAPIVDTLLKTID